MENPNSRIDIEPSLIRLNYLIQEGFTRPEIENMAGINKHTLRSILQGRNKKITQITHDKIKQLHSNYIINKTNKFDKLTEEELEETLYTQNVKSYLWIITGVVITGIIVIIFITKYIIELFN